MRVYKYDEDTGGIVAEDSGLQMDATPSQSPVTINIPMLGSYNYQHGKTGFTKTPAKGQTPTWNLNNPLRNWNFPVLNALKNLFSKDGADPSIPVAASTPSSQIPLGTTDINGDGIINVLDILASRQPQGPPPPPVSGQAPPVSGQAPPSLGGIQDVNNDGAVNVMDILKRMQTPSPSTNQSPSANQGKLSASVDSTDYGLFQINDYWHNEEAQDAIWNQYIPPKDMSSMEQINYAKSLYDKEGWDVWEAYNNGAYSEFLDWTDDDYKDKGVSINDLRRINMFFNNPDGSGSSEESKIAKAIMFAESKGKRDAKNKNKKKANS